MAASTCASTKTMQGPTAYAFHPSGTVLAHRKRMDSRAFLRFKTASACGTSVGRISRNPATRASQSGDGGPRPEPGGSGWGNTWTQSLASVKRRHGSDGNTKRGYCGSR